MELSIVVPCFNEQRRLPATLGAIRAYLGRHHLAGEVILVDDGSRDGTLRLMRAAATRHPEVRVVALSPNRGKGRAVAEGVRVARGDQILVSDADLSTPIEELPKLQRALERGVDVAIGSRAAPGAREIDQPLHRQLMGKSFNRLVQTLLLPGFHDTQCGFKLFRGEVAHELFAGLVTDGFAFDVEILVRALDAGCTVAEVPVRWFSSDASTVSPLEASSAMLRDLVRLRLRFGHMGSPDAWLEPGHREAADDDRT
ncbi:MAG: glycosyltransferase family 2 protein [Candidatus Dormibacteraeota bacterium]|nr:glycosyltransferase family 2 protein [Candidatus Dormibacteraeota bacterium]MBO0708254.1 glycosyltransferase family 2 protein [Candidatus Dormibacteraeota bacterium]